MPATAGRVRMPANNRVHSSAALQTHGIWQSAIGYDPYAPDQKQSSERGGPAVTGGATAEQNAYDSFQGLLALARLTGSNADEARGSCKRCGRVGHLTFQCRNFLAVKEEAVAAAAALMERDGDLRKDKTSDGAGSTVSEEESSEDESDMSDSSEDPDMEKAVMAKFGKNFLKKSKSKGQKKEKLEAPKRKRSSKSHSKRSKSGKDFEDSLTDDSSERDVRRAKKHSKVKTRSKRRHRDSSESDSEDHDSVHGRRKRSKVESESDTEERRKRRKHSHRKSRRSSKHKDLESDEPSHVEGVSRHSSKKKHHKDRKHV